MKLKLLLITNLTMIVAGCATHSVVERSDDLSNKPEWTMLDKAYVERDGKMFFTSFVEVDGSASKSAALNMSDEKALSEPMRSVVESFLDQNQIGEELRKDESFGRRIISATKGYRPPMPSLKVSKRYWEKVVHGDYTADLRAFSLVEISMADFEEAKRNFLARLRKDPEVKKILDEVGKKQRDQVLESAEQQPGKVVEAPKVAQNETH